MAAKRIPFNRRIGRNATGTLDNLDDNRVPGGWLRCYQRFGVENVDNPYTKLRFVFGGTDPEQIISEDPQPQAAEFVWDDQIVWMRAEQFLRAVLTGASADDDISLHVIGYDLIIGTRD
ncbi:hypothetical protein LCGC14_3065150 [marine sediment metagenome]|uniref:Uncharacterized protein n=1 Tax=marine sediment metagenome TaxID=412755 RepID=A0A0F8WHR8_9ZZZZ